MSRFLSRLDVELVGRNLWRLHLPLIYQSDRLNLTVRVPEGFETDFASVPRLPFVYEVMGNQCQEAAVIHDWLYWSKAVDRKTADLILYEAVLASTGERWRAFLMYLGVRIFGASHYGA